MRRTSATALLAPPDAAIHLADLRCEGCGRAAEEQDTVFVQSLGPNGADEHCFCLACAKARGWPAWPGAAKPQVTTRTNP